MRTLLAAEVAVAHVVAAQLAAMLDIFVVRKIGMPGQREYAIGALASGGVLVLDRNIPRRYGVSDADVDAVVQEEQIELARRERAYRRGAPLPPLDGRIVILVDDGLATGATMRAAVQALRTSSPARIVVAVPVGAPSTCAALSTLADEVVCARTPEPFSAVGQWYDDFSETTDEDIERLMHRGPR
jgi:predicted phosphoribosyltransferase